MRNVYLILSYLLHPILKPYLKWRIKKGKEHKERYVEKLGVYTAARLKGKLIWFHAASVGELNSISALIKDLSKRYNILVTTVTFNGYKNFKLKKFPSNVIHQFAPFDTPIIVAKFLKKWHPNLGVFVDSELWPNLILESAKHFPLISLNARMSDKSFKTWQHFKAILASLYSAFSEIYPSSESDRRKILSIVVDSSKVNQAHNLKLSAPKLEFDKKEAYQLSKLLNGRTIIVAASTHKGEEEIILESVHTDKNSILIIVPRHPERGDKIYKLAKSHKVKCALRSKKQKIARDTTIYIADTLGELGLFYHLADLVIMGGSFLPKLGGHNILEPAAFGKAIIIGKHHSNFKNIISEFADNHAIIIADTKELKEQITSLTTNTKQRSSLGKHALNLTSPTDTTKEIMELIENTLKI